MASTSNFALAAGYIAPQNSPLPISNAPDDA
jgi:hypothetical protein